MEQSTSESGIVSQEAKKPQKGTPNLLIVVSNKSSKWWSHFKVYNPVAEGFKKGIAVCIHFNKEIKYQNGLSGMRMHMRLCHKDKIISVDSLDKQTSSSNKKLFIEGLKAFENPNKRTKKDINKEAAVAWVVDEALPFNSVEKKSFRRIIAILDPSAPNLTDANIQEEVAFNVQICKKAVERELKGHFFSLTTDH